MAVGSKGDSPVVFLSGWKAIAGFLHVDKSTAQRWAKGRGLPVRYLPGVKGKVVADIADLDAWTRSGANYTPITSANDEKIIDAQNPGESSMIPQANVPTLPESTPVAGVARRQWLRSAAAGAVVLAGAVFVVGKLDRVYKPPTSYRVDGATLTVSSDDGSVLWRHTFPQELIPDVYQPRARACVFADLDGDGEVATIFKCCPTGSQADHRLICFNSNGNPQWEFREGKTVTDIVGHEFAPPYWPSSFEVIRLPKSARARIIVSSNHHYSFPNQVAVLDGKTGKLLSEYWHRGHLPRMAVSDLDGNGEPDVVLGGVNDAPEYRQATLVVFDHRHIFGACQNPEGSMYFRGMRAGSEKIKIFFPRTPASRDQEFNRVIDIQASRDGVTVVVAEGTAEADLPVVYELDCKLRVRNVGLSDRFQQWYTSLQKTEELPRESSDAITDRLAKEVKVQFNAL